MVSIPEILGIIYKVTNDGQGRRRDHGIVISGILRPGC